MSDILSWEGEPTTEFVATVFLDVTDMGMITCDPLMPRCAMREMAEEDPFDTLRQIRAYTETYRLPGRIIDSPDNPDEAYEHVGYDIFEPRPNGRRNLSDFLLGATVETRGRLIVSVREPYSSTAI